MSPPSAVGTSLLVDAFVLGDPLGVGPAGLGSGLAGQAMMRRSSMTVSVTMAF